MNDDKSQTFFGESNKYCTGNCNMVPYNVSAAEQFISFFTVVQSPKTMSGTGSS